VPITEQARRGVAVVNGGSSSIKFALYSAAPALQRTFDGELGLDGAHGAGLTFTDRSRSASAPVHLAIPAAASASDFLAGWLQAQAAFRFVQVVGHRVVLGLQHREPAIVTPTLLQELRRASPLDPDHLPLEIELIEAFSRRFPGLPQLLCFDTAFHHDMPRVAKMLPIPRHYEAQGIHRYGFHGLSYTYVMEELVRLGDPAATTGRVILAHLGNGASMAAVQAGACIDTSMGFTPASGLMMGTRSGDLDPGLVSFLIRSGQMTPARFDHMVNRESGLLGVSQLSSDVRDLLGMEARDPRAAEALALFCYQAKKCIGSYVAALGGLDALVFTGGIGENAPLIRQRICDGLQCFGIQIDPERNTRNAGLISPDDAGARVRVMRTDEELIIARACAAMLAAPDKGKA
jgi:acetate kinase